MNEELKSLLTDKSIKILNRLSKRKNSNFVAYTHSAFINSHKLDVSELNNLQEIAVNLNVNKISLLKNGITISSYVSDCNRKTVVSGLLFSKSIEL